MKLKIFLSLIPFILTAEITAQYFYNQWANFDGINDYLAAGNNIEITLDTAFTIEGWIFVQDTTGTNKTIISKVNTGLSDGYALLVQGSSSSPGNAGKLQLNLNGSTYVFAQTASTRLALNGWSHFAVTFKDAFPNSDTIRFYINGSLIQSFTSNMPGITNPSDSLRAGNCYIPGSYSNGFRGRLDNLRIFKSVKSAAVIANNRGIPLGMEMTADAGLLGNAVYFSNLTASWNFDGNGNDRIGNYNDLVSNGGAFYSGNGFNPDNYRTQSNYYMRFPGTSWLSAADVSNSNFDLETEGTLEAWVYIDAYRASPQTIISKGTTSYSYILAIASSPANTPVFILNSGSKFLQSSKPILPRVWTHICATYRASTGLMELFVNGTPDTSRTTTPGNITVSNDSLFIGKSLFGEYMYGNIDAVKISKYAKIQPEISSFVYTSLDNLNFTGNPQLQAGYNFEGNTINNINSSNFMKPVNNVYFERLNNTSGAGGASQAPVLRTSNNDGGFVSNSYFLNTKLLHVGNGAAVRDSILINNVSGTNRVIALVLMNHTNSTDVTLNLRAPNGTSVNMIQAAGGTNNDIMTVFDDLADSLINTNFVPFSMRVRPASPLSALPQTNQNGYWRLTVTDNASAVDSGRVYLWGIKFISSVGISNNNEFSDEFHLSQNYPNPFNPITKIKFYIPGVDAEGNGLPATGRGVYVSLVVYDILGREAASLIPSGSMLQPGTYEIEWDAKNYPSGVYFYKLISVIYSKTHKMVLIK